jgi:predicted transcriptional regulator
MLQMNDLTRLIGLLADRQLQPRDTRVLLALMSCIDSYTGRIHTTAFHLAELLKTNESEIRSAIGRLKKQHLLRLIKEPRSGKRYYLINPWLVQAGKQQAIGLAMKTFREA